MTMGAGQFTWKESILFDARRAAWFPEERILAVADLHLGYAWAHRLSGQLMPITPTNDTLERLRELQREFRPSEIVVLGDIVHRAMALPALEKELRELIRALSPDSRLTFLAGNHDRDLQNILDQWAMPVDLLPSRQIGRSLLVHGEIPPQPAVPKSVCVVMGHEHPAITIGDGVTTSQKCPCFLVSETVLILPAFSRWAAGTNIGAHPFMSEIARAAKFSEAIAICGEKLLPVRL